MCSCVCPCSNTFVVQEDGPILGWDGAIMSTFSSEAADWAQSGYGPLLATPSVRVSPLPYVYVFCDWTLKVLLMSWQ